mgnify:CR=1 FL=1
MSKTRKINLLCLVFAAICCLFAGILFGSTTKASAAEPIEPKTFEMVSGASIRITDGQVNGKDMTNGLRFQVKTDAETAKLIDGENVKLYAFIAPVGVIDLTSDEKVAAAADNIVGYKSKWLEIAADSIYPMKEESGEVCYYANAVICNLSSDFYDVKFNAIAIIENGGVYTYAKAVSTSRSLYDVVNSAVLDKYADRIVGDSVAENTKLDYANWYGKGEYPVSPKTAAQYAKYNELKGTTLQNLDIVRQDVLVDNATVTIGGTSYPIDIPSEHGEQEVSVTVDGTEITVPVTIIDAVLTAENLKENIQSQGTALSEGKYFVLDGDIDASGIDWKADTLWAAADGFKGTIDGRGYAVKNLNIEDGVPGIFNCTENAVVKNINFTVANFVPQANKSVFGVITKKTLIENVTVTFDCVFTATTGGILSGNNAVGNTYRNVKVTAEGSEIFYLISHASNGGSGFDGVVAEAKKINYIYGTITSVNGITTGETKEVTLTDNQDILLTNDTYSVSLGAEQTGLIIQSISCDGIDLGKDLNNLDMSQIKNDLTKHGMKNIMVKGLKDGVKAMIIVPVTIVTRHLTNGAELKEAVYCSAIEGEKDKGAYYVLPHNVNVIGTGFSGGGWGELGKVGFAGTLDGRGHKIVNVNLSGSYGLFNALKDAVIKNVEIEVAQLNTGANASVFGVSAQDSVFENITVTFTNTFTGVQCGVLGGGNQSRGCTFKDITVNAQGSDIYRLFSAGGIVKDSKDSISGVVVNAKSVQYMYETTDLTASGFAGVTINPDK